MSSTEGQNVMSSTAEERDLTPGADAIEVSLVIGTSVYNIEGEHIGHIQDLVLGKQDGQVRYAVLAAGGFLGIGEEHHPLPWHILKYDPRQQGYVIGVTIDQLRGAPRHAAEARAFSDPDYGRSIDDYWRGAAI